MPLDVHTRERMRQAQAAEARAVNEICAAQAALERAAGKRYRVVEAADATVRAAEHELAKRHASLIAVSGLDRAAALLGTSPAQLRRAAARTRAESGEPA